MIPTECTEGLPSQKDLRFESETMFERFTDRSRRVLVYAQDEARDLHADIGTEHLLLGLIRESDGIAAKALGAVGITYDSVREKIEGKVSADDSAKVGSPPFTPRAKKVLEFALREALQLGHNYIGTEHLLLGILREGGGAATQILTEFGVELTGLHDKVLEMMSGQSDPEPGASPLRETNNIAGLLGIVRSTGRQLRPDLDATTLSERTTKITEELLKHLRKSWSDPETP
jgi:ATP-dependent Clp protease ATP-binding subunit ClpA